ncbi:MliC family protein [uncultured Endozoicomonas sp.]|uniref:MliC family protein n=1 Tax=uncultured Endozoicomonas sp. TaxID=432652 RepID=UPI00261A02AB|nr:MliC family protein [uncultured Endozoicomonas sp.]
MATFVPYKSFCAISLIVVSVFYLSGCVQRDTRVLSTAEATNLAYDCEHGFRFVASVEPDHAWLFISGETISLPRAVSASGAKFNHGANTYWSSKEEALVEYQGKAYKQCKINRKRSIWEDAKLKGYEFRGVGNEPGWVLTIRNSNELNLRYAYGQESYHFSSAQKVVDKRSGITEYMASSAGHTLKVKLEGKTCNDSMADETYSVRVDITLDGVTHNGCGRALRG